MAASSQCLAGLGHEAWGLGLSGLVVQLSSSVRFSGFGFMVPGLLL